jgi:hypothetical protein
LKLDLVRGKGCDEMIKIPTEKFRYKKQSLSIREKKLTINKTSFIIYFIPQNVTDLGIDK